MSALGQKQTFRSASAMSALPPKADMCGARGNVRFGPKADISVIRLQFSDLCVGSERPSGKRTNDSLGKFAPPHWIPRGSGQGIVAGRVSNVRFRSKAGICAAIGHVCFTPQKQTCAVQLGTSAKGQYRTSVAVNPNIIFGCADERGRGLPYFTGERRGHGASCSGAVGSFPIPVHKADSDESPRRAARCPWQLFFFYPYCGAV
jgi:hypothetical protein